VEFSVQSFGDDTRLVFTTTSPASHYGIPVLRHEGCGVCLDMGPADHLPPCVPEPWGGQVVAHAVCQWQPLAALEPMEQEAVRLFLAQWPQGPQMAAGESGVGNG
jgi:hypothetical protein